eukprot:scaffold13353_cov51-Phaeocystis_antarctica.AAC.1
MAGGSIGLKGGSRPCQRRVHSFLRRDAGSDAIQFEALERRQRAAVEREGKSDASRAGDLGVVEVDVLELLQPSSRQRPRTCRRRRRRHEGGEALVAERVVVKTESVQRGQPPQGRREGHQPRVADGGVAQTEDLEPRQGASAQGGGERRGACVAHRHVKAQQGHGRQRARAQLLRQPLHAAGAG